MINPITVVLMIGLIAGLIAFVLISAWKSRDAKRELRGTLFGIRDDLRCDLAAVTQQVSDLDSRLGEDRDLDALRRKVTERSEENERAIRALESKVENSDDESENRDRTLHLRVERIESLLGGYAVGIGELLDEELAATSRKQLGEDDA
jgi:hypothetical protein